jgi:hypothetical protein
MALKGMQMYAKTGHKSLVNGSQFTVKSTNSELRIQEQ